MKKYLSLFLMVTTLGSSFAANFPQIELNETVKFSGPTQKEEPAVGGYSYTLIGTYEINVKKDQKIGIGEVNSGFACMSGTQKEGPFFTFVKDKKMVSTSDKVWFPSNAVSKESLVLNAAPGIYHVVVTAYSSNPCFQVGGSFQLIQK